MVKDLYIFENEDGGDLRLINDDLEMVTCATNQIYLALFGGNKNGLTPADPSPVFVGQNLDWWGNSLMAVDNQFNSRTEKIINEIAITQTGLSRLKSAVEEDLKFLDAFYDVGITINQISYVHVEIYVTLQTKEGEFIMKFDCGAGVDLSYSRNGIDYVPSFEWLWSDNDADKVLFSDNPIDIATYR